AAPTPPSFPSSARPDPAPAAPPLHDALPILIQKVRGHPCGLPLYVCMRFQDLFHSPPGVLFAFPSRYWFTIGRQRVFSLGGWSRSEEHTSELQSRENLVCRLLLDKKTCSQGW